MYGVHVHSFNTASYEPRPEKNMSPGFKTRSDTRRAVQPQKLALGLEI